MLVALLAIVPAHAYLYGGNPAMDFRVDRPAHDLVGGSVTVDKVRVHKCSGGVVDYPVDETIDPVEGLSVSIDGGDLCHVRIYWSTSMELLGDGTYGTFELAYEEPYTTVNVDSEAIGAHPLTPFDLVDGQMSPGAPALIVTIE